MTRDPRPRSRVVLAARVLAVAAFVAAMPAPLGAVTSPEPWRPPTGGAAAKPGAATGPIAAFDDTLARPDRTYRFEDYPGEPWAGGKPVDPDLTSHPRAKEAKSLLRGAVLKGPNFAGPYMLVPTGCGRACLQFFVADARTGRVWVPAFRGRTGYEFRKDSRLLVVDPPAYVRAAQRVSPQIGALWTKWFVWTGAGFALVDSSLVEPAGAKVKE